MLARAADGRANEGDWLVAKRQTLGRGRHGRTWLSPPGNLYASGLVTLRPTDPPAPTLALVAGLAVREVVAHPGLLLKWPNDLVVGAAKLAGILLERAGDAVVIGIGVNVAHRPALPGRETASLASLSDTRSARDLVVPLADALRRWSATWRVQGLAVVRDAWLAGAHPVGTALTARLGDGSQVEGTFDGLTDGCALVLRLADGRARVIHAADVFFT